MVWMGAWYARSAACSVSDSALARPLSVGRPTDAARAGLHAFLLAGAVRAVGRCGRVGGLSVAEASTLEMPLRVAARLESPALFLVVLVALIRRGRVPRASSPCLFPGPVLLLALWWPQPRGAQVLRRHRLRSGERALWTSALLVGALGRCFGGVTLVLPCFGVALPTPLAPSCCRRLTLRRAAVISFP